MIHKLPAEDAVILQQPDEKADGIVDIAVPMLSRIANFDDFDPLRLEPQIRLRMIPPGEAIPANASLIIRLGTKATIADLKFLRAQGWDIDITAHVRRGGHVLGICGGYQMLGRTISDRHAIEGATETVAGLGLLPAETNLTTLKILTNISGKTIADDAELRRYEIHVGDTQRPPSTPRCRQNTLFIPIPATESQSRVCRRKLRYETWIGFYSGSMRRRMPTQLRPPNMSAGGLCTRSGAHPRNSQAARVIALNDFQTDTPAYQ